MIYHWQQGNDNIFVRCDSVTEAREIFNKSCSVRSPLRERALFVRCQDPVELPDSLGYIIDRKLGDRCKDIYFFNGTDIAIYLSKGYEPVKATLPVYEED